MRLEYKSQKELEKEVLEIIGRHLDLSQHKIFFFGSRVSEKGSERSDIDIGIEGVSPISDSTLGLIREEIEELPLLYSIDIVDFSRVDDDFKNVAKENIEVINP